MRKKYLVLILAMVLTAVGFLSVRQELQAEGYSPRTMYASELSTALSASNLESKLKEFIGTEEDNRYDRTTFTTSERNAAEWINDKLLSYGLDSKVLDFEIGIPVNKSQNVEARIKSKADNAQQVVIGASYDNNFSEIKISGSATTSPAKKAHGVLENGTSVAIVLALAEYYASAELPFDLVFNFYGASQVGIGGSRMYVENMGNIARANTLAMFSLGRIGADNLYSYYDEVATEHGEFVDKIATESNVNLQSLPWFKPISPQFYSKTVPYSHYGLLYDSVAFLDAKVSSVAIFGGNYSNMKLSNSESTKDNIIGTTLDNLVGVAAAFPQFAARMSQAASVIANVINSEQFVTVFAASEKSAFNYSIFASKAIASFIKLFLIIVIAIILIILINKLAKIEKPNAKQVKLTVFGTDYEEGNKEDFVDFKVRTADDIKKDNNPFDGY